MLAKSAFCILFFIGAGVRVAGQAPSWVGTLPQSSITTVSLNNPAAVMPTALAAEVAGWDVSYSGFAFAPDYSTHGAMLASGGGGYVADIYCAAAFDMATRLWVPVWTEIPPLTWADGSEFSFNAADMPPDAKSRGAIDVGHIPAAAGGQHGAVGGKIRRKGDPGIRNVPAGYFIGKGRWHHRGRGVEADGGNG